MNWSNDLMGQWVDFNQYLSRRRVPIGNREVRCTWKPVKTSPRRGMIVGRRWLQNGVVLVGYDHYDPNVWTHEETVPCLLVVENDRTNPIHIPYEGVI